MNGGVIFMMVAMQLRKLGFRGSNVVTRYRYREKISITIFR